MVDLGWRRDLELSEERNAVLHWRDKGGNKASVEAVKNSTKHKVNVTKKY